MEKGKKAGLFFLLLAACFILLLPCDDACDDTSLLRTESRLLLCD